MDDFLQRTPNTSSAYWPRAQAFRPNSSLVKRDIGLRCEQAVLGSNTFISFSWKIQICRRNTHCEQVLKNRILIKIEPWDIKDVSNNAEY